MSDIKTEWIDKEIIEQQDLLIKYLKAFVAILKDEITTRKEMSKCDREIIKLLKGEV